MFVWQNRLIASGEDLLSAVIAISEPEVAAEFRRAYRMALIAGGSDPAIADRNIVRLLDELVAAYALSLSRIFFPEELAREDALSPASDDAAEISDAEVVSEVVSA
ncbi:MAG TPA: hypothetical protein VD838_23095 [Anaeromyxobacteraceae bacterium]|nr:hypothetical protein [Anaeromyxobacteraceae bacterium]